MSLFQCPQCGCCENTALAPWTYPKERICSACGEGKWHDVFRRVFLPKGEFFTNARGNLQHRKTGSEDIEQFEVKP
jgi:hypothetical protein